MQLEEKLKYIIENTDLFIQANGHYPNVVSDWGRAKSIDLNKGTVRFSRYEVTKRMLGSEMAWGQDIFLRTEIELKMTSFEIIKNYCKDDGSWERWKMDELKIQSWDDLYNHVRNIEINKNWLTKLRFWLGGKKLYIKYDEK